MVSPLTRPTRSRLSKPPRGFNNMTGVDTWRRSCLLAKVHVREVAVLVAVREPIKLLTFVLALCDLLSMTFFHFTVPQQAAVNSALAILVGVLGALMVSVEKTLPLISGFVQAVLACVLAFGLVLDSNTQASIMAFTAAATGMWLRTQVVAPVGPQTPAVGQP